MTVIRRSPRPVFAGLLAVALCGSLAPAALASSSSPSVSSAARVVVPLAQRSSVLGKSWRTSTDRAWTTIGDGDGFHLLIADASQGYAWRTVATLSEPGLETDQWIGNVCLTGSGRRAVVAYAPRTFTNKETLFARGAFTAVVDLKTGAVRKLAARTSLAYFNPSCGAAEDVVLTQAGDTDLGRTRLLELDAATGKLGHRIEVKGQLTSAVPTSIGIVAADSGALVRVDSTGRRRVLAPARGVPFRVAADAEGGVVYLEHNGTDGVAVRRVDASRPSAVPVTPATLATGPLTGLQVESGRGGRVFVTGGSKSAKINPSVSLLAAPVDSEISTTGELALTSTARSGHADPRVPVADPGAAQPVTITATVLATRKPLTFTKIPTNGGTASGRELTPSSTSVRTLAASSSSDPSDAADRYCSVPRNDPGNQAMQPKPRQVEWAVDQAVRNSLYVSRPANWKNLKMPAYSPQDLFPPVALDGGGYVPAQVMLGVAAQESNLWQAARFAVPGVTANPLIGNYYGLDIYNSSTSDDWTIRWDKADCGYGVTQVTDGMRLAGHEKPGEHALPYQTQRAVALDFAANIAAGVQILEKKWNETRAAEMTINNGDSSKLENWFYALWAYNAGFHPLAEAAANNGAWGVGWGNNPANPNYPANRDSFLDRVSTDAAHPQLWPYEEKVLGFAGHPIQALESPDVMVAGYRQAFWNGVAGVAELRRTNVKPPNPQFCDYTNRCTWGELHKPDAPGLENEPAGPCYSKDPQDRYDLHCWYHFSSTWKADCADSCGNEVLRFDPGYAYQDDGTAYPPACDLTGLPTGAEIVDDVPNGTDSIRPGCQQTWSSKGTFTLSYPQDGDGNYPGKIDTHQIGSGFGGHFWMANARDKNREDGKLKVIGTWSFSTPRSGLARVWVALPVTGAGDAKTYYEVKTRYGWRVAWLQQKSTGSGNRWVSLGMYPFDGLPEVRLSTDADGADGTLRVAFDAAAIEPVNDTATVKLLHWNLAGSAKNRGDFHVVDRLVQEVLAKQPDVVTMNEVCGNQFENAKSKLADAGYQMEGHFITSQVANVFCGSLGSLHYEVGAAILVRGSISANKDYVFVGSTLVPGVPAINDRVVGCSTARITGTTRDTKICTTHLAQEDGSAPDPYAQPSAQAEELARVFGPDSKTTPTILAGDMNLPAPPRRAALAKLYSGDLGDTGDFYEVDGERACLLAPTCDVQQGGTNTQYGNGGQKLDYVFADRWHFSIPLGRVSVDQDVGHCVEGEEFCSDHYLMYSEMTIQR